MALTKRKVLVSEAAQTILRDSDTQYLVWDVTKEPTRHPSNFPKGRGLKYPILYDPAWPVDISKTQKVTPSYPQRKLVMGIYALKGMTSSEKQRRARKKTLIFPHRNSDLPFRRPTSKVMHQPSYDPCETLSLRAVEELEPHVLYRSVLESIPKYDEMDTQARAMELRKVLQLSPPSVAEPSPPRPQRRKSRRTRTEDVDKRPPSEEVKASVETLFVDEGPYCQIHDKRPPPKQLKSVDFDDIFVDEGPLCQIHGAIDANHMDKKTK